MQKVNHEVILKQRIKRAAKGVEVRYEKSTMVRADATLLCRH